MNKKRSDDIPAAVVTLAIAAIYVLVRTGTGRAPGIRGRGLAEKATHSPACSARDQNGPPDGCSSQGRRAEGGNQRKTALAAELTKLSELAGIEALDETQLKRELHDPVADVKTPLEQNTTQARQMLRKLLAGSKIEMESFGEGRGRGYKFRGELSIGKLVAKTQTGSLPESNGAGNSGN